MTQHFRYVHETGPLDYWAGLVTLREIVDNAQACHKAAVDTLGTLDTGNLRGAIATAEAIPYATAALDGIDLDAACWAISEAMNVLSLSPFQWEGDAAGLDSVALMMRPDDGGTAVWAVVIKQSNNGSTFVVSDVPWPWPTPGMAEWTFTVDPVAQWCKDRGYREGSSPSAVCDECGNTIATDQVTCEHCGLDLPRNGRAVEFRDGRLSLVARIK